MEDHYWYWDFVVYHLMLAMQKEARLSRLKPAIKGLNLSRPSVRVMRSVNRNR